MKQLFVIDFILFVAIAIHLLFDGHVYQCILSIPSALQGWSNNKIFLKKLFS